MAQRYDVSLKVLFLSEGDGIIRRLLFGGGRITEFLTTEQPLISNRRADLLVRTDDRRLHQVEFEASNKAGFALRMLEYYIYLVRTYGEHVAQVVLYLGRSGCCFQPRPAWYLRRDRGQLSRPSLLNSRF